MNLKQTWRWFGPADPVTLDDILQTGAKGIVTALHHVPHGDLWTKEEILKRKNEIESKGLTWDVVESVTVHEDIKTRSGNFQHYIDLYKQTLRNLAACGIKIVTYNFMPVNDWTRTNLNYPMPDGSKALYFNLSDLAVFDIYILQRENAAKDYEPEIVQLADEKHKRYTEKELADLAGIIMFGIPGEKKITVEDMRKKLAAYEKIDRNLLRDNLAYFLSEICPTG